MGHEKERSPPGAAVREAMERIGWSQPDLAFVAGVTTSTVNQIINGKRGISGNMAALLGRALDVPPERFAKLQAEWEVRQVDELDPIVGTRARVLSEYPLREMIKRGWIPASASSAELELRMCKFFDVPSFDEVPHLSHAAKSTNYTHIPAEQLAWLFRVRQISKEIAVEGYSKEKLEGAVKAFSELRSEPESIRYVPRLLRDAGVRFVVVESLPGGKIDGVCLWLDAKSPVIGMSLRFDRIDNFWFVLRHECAHVLHGHGRDTGIVDVELDGDVDASTNDEERLANQNAAEFCVPSDKMQSFYLRKNPLFSELEVLAFAKRMDVHPGLVIGQLQRMTDRYDLLRRHLVEIRQHLAIAMMMDGWGDTVPVEG